MTRVPPMPPRPPGPDATEARLLLSAVLLHALVASGKPHDPQLNASLAVEQADALLAALGLV